MAVRTIIGSNLIADAMSRSPLAPTAANALGRALMGGVLIAVGSAEVAAGRAASEEASSDETLQLQFRGDGPLGTMMVISDALGRVRGTIERPGCNLQRADGSPDVARAVGLGTLTVVRHREGWGEPYSGTVPLVSGEVARDMTLYLTESEQTPSAMGLGVATDDDESGVAAAGFLIQTLPNAASDELRQIEANIRALPRLTQLVLTGIDCHGLLDRLLDGVGSLERHASEPIYYCPCTPERALRTLALLGRPELRQMVDEGKTQEVRCHFCARAYDFSIDEIGSILPDA